LQKLIFQVQVKANDHSKELDKKIKEIDDDLQLIDKLKKWLASAEHKLKVQNQQPIQPDDVERWALVYLYAVRKCRLREFRGKRYETFVNRC